MKDKLEYELSLRDLFTKKMDEAIGKVDKLDKKLGGMKKKNDSLGSSFGRLGSMIAGAFSVGAVISFGGAVIESLKKYESFMAATRTMLGGNAQAAEALNAQLVALARTTPFSLEDVRLGAKQLLAYGFQAGKVTDQLRVLGDVAAATGTDIKDLTWLHGTTAVQQRLFSKDLYQYLNRGIPLVKELAKQFKVSESAIKDLVEKGKVGFKDVDQALRSMTSSGGQFFNMMEEQSKTIGGRISNLGDAWEQLKTEIGLSQKGIIAGTVSFMEEMTSAMANGFKMDNFRDKINSKLGESSRVHETSWYNPLSWFGGDEKQDERFVASDKYGRRRISRNSTEHSQFLNSMDGEGFNDNGTIGTEARLLEFQDKWMSKFDNVSANPNALSLATMKSELLNEKLGIRKEQIAGTISSPLGRSELATIDEFMSKLDGLAKLNKIDAVKPEPINKDKKEELGTGIDTSMHRPQNLYISIDRLVESFNVNSTTVQESATKIKDLVAQALIEAVNDANYIDAAGAR